MLRTLAPSLRRVLLASLLLAGALPRASAGEYKRVYEQGLSAVRRGYWGDVAGDMLSAIAEEPTEKAQIRFTSMTVHPYLPHFYLGMAYAKLGRCEEAQREWAVSVQQGAIAGLPEQSQLEASRKACGGAPGAARGAPPVVARPTPPPAPPGPSAVDVQAARATLARADAVARDLEPLRPDPLLATAWAQGAEERRKQAQALLASAASEIDHAADAAALQAASGKAEQARGAFVDLTRDLRAQLTAAQGGRQRQDEDARSARHDDLVRQVAALIAEDRGLLATTAPDPRPEVTRERKSLARALPSGDVARLDDPALDHLRLRLTTATALLTRAASSPAPAGAVDAASRAADRATLRMALQPFFAGDYVKTLQLLGAQSFITQPARTQAALVTAAAAHALYLLSGETDAQRLAIASDAARRCRALDPALRPSSSAFSPRFLSFFAALR